MTKELFQLLTDTPIDSYNNFNQIPADLSGIMQSLKFVYSEEDIDALSSWTIEDVQDINLVQWTTEVKGLLEELSGTEINSIESLMLAYANTYGNRVDKLAKKVKEELEMLKLDIAKDILVTMDSIWDTIRSSLSEVNTDRTISELTEIIYSRIQ